MNSSIYMKHYTSQLCVQAVEVQRGVVNPGFTALQNEQLVLNYVRQHGQIKRAEVMGLCRLSADQAKKLLGRLRDGERLVQHGTLRGAFYTAGPQA